MSLQLIQASFMGAGVFSDDLTGPGLGTLWMVAGLVVAALEMVAPGVFLIWIGLAGFGTGAIMELLRAVSTGPVRHVLETNLAAQFGLFAVLLAALILWVRQRLRRPTLDRVNAPAAGLIGQTCRALAFQDGEGRVSFGDGAWSARMTDRTTPATGQPLRIVGLDGTTLLVAAHL